MADKKGDRKELKIMTPEFRGSFVTLKKPRAFGNSEPKYSITIVLPEDHEFWKKLRDVCEKAAIKRWEKVPANMHFPIRLGSETEYDDWQGCRFAQAASEDKPGIIDRDGEEIVDMSQVYSGAWFRATIRAYAWHYPETNKKGVSLQLDNVMKVRDDEAFSGRAQATDDFSDYVGKGDESGGDETPRKSERSGRREERSSKRGGSGMLD